MSLDGVMQAPGGPLEDTTGGFALGGWTFTYWDAVMGQSMAGLDGKDRELVLGRETYEIYETHWPYQPAADPTALSLNAAKKHVASRTLANLHWNNSTLLRGDVAAAVEAVEDGQWDVYVGVKRLGRLHERHMRIEDEYGRLKRCDRPAREEVPM